MRTNAPSLAAHPDANLLTAFAERSLAERERKSVLAHLAQCGDCRDIVALALPDIDSSIPVDGARIPWFRVPALRWAAVGVGVVVIVSIGTLQYRNRSMRIASLKPYATRELQPNTLETRTQMRAAPEPDKKILAKKQMPERLGGSETASALPRATIHTFANALRGNVAAGSSDGAGRGTIFGKENLTARGTNFAIASASPTPSVPTVSAPAPTTAQQKAPSVSETVEVSAEAGPVQTAQAEFPTDKDTLSRAKPPVSDQIETGQATMPIQGRDVTSLQTLAATAPRWTIAANGTLQRSIDGGATWQDVNVTGEASISSLVVEEKTAEAQASKKSLAKRYAAAFPVFRVAAVNGMEVWAGGASGILYHTVDAGNSWSRVVPSYEGEPLGGDIVGIQFPDPQHGQISTSTGEVWTTADSGQTWRKL